MKLATGGEIEMILKGMFDHSESPAVQNMHVEYYEPLLATRITERKLSKWVGSKQYHELRSSILR
jgi:hypothetical protein